MRNPTLGQDLPPREYASGAGGLASQAIVMTKTGHEAGRMTRAIARRSVEPRARDLPAQDMWECIQRV